MTNIQELLAANIKAFRNELGLTQSKLAEEVGASTRYIAKIEGGENYPSPEMVGRIASALKKDTPDLFAITPIKKNWQKRILTEMENVIQKHILELGNDIDNPNMKKHL
jgi:transcriptional regulator with XRE-family HTH domain